VHYTGTLAHGAEFDSSHNRNEPIEFAVGAGQMIKGFDDAVLGMEEGQTKTVTLDSSEAYGERNDDAFATVPLPEDFTYAKGDRVVTQTEDGRQMQATITEVTDETVTLDFNHPLAGEQLTFEIELLEIAEQTHE
jgi:peptidylprolyl isomerase